MHWTVGRQKTRLRGSRHTNSRYPTRGQRISASSPYLEGWLKKKMGEFIILSHAGVPVVYLLYSTAEASSSGSPPFSRAGASSAASNREKRKRVSYGDATSYSAAEPSIAPSAIAVVLKRPSDG